MALEKIEISGFKSFAESTRIQFSKGINVIVGPNGCGKSNIVDGFLWALGQQSAKTLRATVMQDVLFAGSLNRKAMKMAEVTVVLSNENGLLPIEYQEVAITRRLYRDGESEYLINGQSVRLKDIVELLAHTGVGKEAFAVIGQGKVAEIISQSPQDRRTLFEEVAGISHFLIKRKESERKLELAKTNVSRAKDIVLEVEGQKKTLEKQAHDAKRFQEMRQKLACYERILCQNRFNEIKALCQKLSSDTKASQEQLKASQEQETKLKTELQQKKEALKACQKAYSDLHDAEHLLERSIQAIKKDIDFCEEKKGTLSSQEKESSSQLKTFEDRIKSLTEQKDALEKTLATKEKELTALREQKDAAFTEWQKKFSEQETLETTLKSFYSKRFSLQSRMQSCESDLKKCQFAEEVAKEKVRDRLLQKEKFETLKAQSAEESRQKKQELQEALAVVEKLKKSLEDETALLKEQTKLIEDQKSKSGQIKQELYQKEARCKALSQLADHLEGYTSGAKTLLQEAKKESSQLYKKVIPLADALNLEHELLGRLYETSLLVSTKADLDLALAVSKNLDVSFVCLELLGLTSPDQLANHFLQKITPAVWLEGKYYVDGFGVLHVAKAKGETIFTRSKEIKTLQQEIIELKKTLTALEESVQKIEAKKQQLATEVQKYDQEMRRADMQVVSINFQLQSSEKRLQEIQRDVERSESEMASLNELTAKLKTDVTKKEEELSQAKTSLTALEAEFKACELKAEAIRADSSTSQEKKQKTFYRYDDCLKTVEKDRHALELLLVQKKEVTSRLDQEIKLQKTIQQERASLDGKKEDTAKVLEGKSQELVAIKAQLAVHKEQAQTLETETKKFDAALEELQKQKEEQIKTSSSQQTELTSLQEQLITYDTALRQPAPEGLSLYADAVPTEDEIVRLKNSVERMRNVNLLAVEEHEAACQRFELLMTQLQDLENAERELMQIVAALEKESSKAFSETFEAVRVAFQKHFQTLFQGGDADLVLCDEGQGVDIFAKPPGKQMRSMQLLSGGEKTLTALALLFACFDVRPSPFCILDEVDAPLDETNVERLGKLLQHFCERTQFLVITHNKKTMQISDTLIGVSMAEKGVSQIIAMDFKRREAAVAVL